MRSSSVSSRIAIYVRRKVRTYSQAWKPVGSTYHFELSSVITGTLLGLTPCWTFVFKFELPEPWSLMPQRHHLMPHHPWVRQCHSAMTMYIKHEWLDGFGGIKQRRGVMQHYYLVNCTSSSGARSGFKRSPCHVNATMRKLPCVAPCWTTGVFLDSQSPYFPSHAYKVHIWFRFLGCERKINSC